MWHLAVPTHGRLHPSLCFYLKLIKPRCHPLRDTLLPDFLKLGQIEFNCILQKHLCYGSAYFIFTHFKINLPCWETKDTVRWVLVFLITEQRTASNIHSVLQSSTNQLFCFYFSGGVTWLCITSEKWLLSSHSWEQIMQITVCVCAALPGCCIHSYHSLYLQPPPTIIIFSLLHRDTFSYSFHSCWLVLVFAASTWTIKQNLFP